MDTCNIPEQDLSIVIVGHVDHGKSTVIGRLLADTDSLPKGKLEQIRQLCRATSKPFEYAFLLDALKDERAQGITIDMARCFFKTEKRRYILIDAPGHIEFLKNMITGASRAEAALLVIDAAEGIRENSRRHGYMLSMLGIKQVCVLVNKMDLVSYDKDTYDGIVKNYTAFLSEVGLSPMAFIPVSAMQGDNIAALSGNMPWYEGMTVLGALDSFAAEPSLDELPFRMPVQDVYKFTSSGDERRIVAGTVEAGKISVGDEVVFFPSGKRSKVKTIECFNRPSMTTASSGWAAGFTLEEQIYVKRGEIAAKLGEHEPEASTRFRTSLFWLGRAPMVTDKTYFLKIGSAKVHARISEIISVLDASTLERVKKDRIERHEVAECIIECERSVAYDLSEEMAATSRFVVVDDYEISGGGIITASLEDCLSDIRQKVLLRNFKWERSSIPSSMRAEKHSQKSALVIITGETGKNKKSIAKQLESRLFAEGRLVYYLGIASVLYGVDADIKTAGSQAGRDEHIRRLAEVSNIILDMGAILIVTATELAEDEIELFRAVADTEDIVTCWIGGRVTTDASCEIQIKDSPTLEGAVEIIRGRLTEGGII
ncbi:MAG: GTP-binding protein [Eubacteriales bacterium]